MNIFPQIVFHYDLLFNESMLFIIGFCVQLQILLLSWVQLVKIVSFVNYLMVDGRISTDVSKLTIFLSHNFPPGQHVRQTSSAYSAGRRFRNLRATSAIGH